MEKRVSSARGSLDAVRRGGEGGGRDGAGRGEARWVYDRRKNIACSFMALRGHKLLRLLIPLFLIDPFIAVFSFKVTSDRLSAA